MDAVWPGFNVSGTETPRTPKSEPATEIDEIITGAEPDEVTAIVAVAVVPTVTLPNDTDVGLRVNAAVPDAGTNAIVKGAVNPPPWAVMVAVCAKGTAATVALKPVVIAPGRTVTPPGTLTDGLLLVRVMCILLVAGEVR